MHVCEWCKDIRISQYLRLDKFCRLEYHNSLSIFREIWDFPKLFHSWRFRQKICIFVATSTSAKKFIFHSWKLWMNEDKEEEEISSWENPVFIRAHERERVFLFVATMTSFGKFSLPVSIFQNFLFLCLKRRGLEWYMIKICVDFMTIQIVEVNNEFPTTIVRL